MAATVVKALLMAASVLVAAVGAQNVFRFSQQDGAMPAEAGLPLQFDLKQAFADFNSWLWDSFMQAGSHITSYFQAVLPSSTPTFGFVVTTLMILALLWILSSKFESTFRTLILVGMMIAVVMLILSAVGFV